MTPLKTFRNLPLPKQRRIIEVAVNEFGEKGYEGASINAMVQRLGIAKGSMFQYFGDKEGLFLFIFSESMEMVKNNLKRVREETRSETLDLRLQKTLEAGVRFTVENPRVYTLYLKILSESKFPFREEVLRSLRSYSLEYIREFLETARTRGEIREGIDIDRAAFMIDALMDRFLQVRVIPHLDAGLGLHNADESTAKEWSRSLVDLLLRGMGRS